MLIASLTTVIAVGDGRVVLTVEVAGAVELYAFDLKTLRPLGQVRLAPKP